MTEPIHKTGWVVEDPFGPDYNVESPALRKHRRLARAGLAALDRAERQAYGAAVEAAVLASQRARLVRAAPTFKANCASGTFHNDGAALHAALLNQQRAAAVAAPGQIRRARSPEQWRTMYAEAMAEKRAALAPRALILVGHRGLINPTPERATQ
jgi:hypothetical protein